MLDALPNTPVSSSTKNRDTINRMVSIDEVCVRSSCLFMYEWWVMLAQCVLLSLSLFYSFCYFQPFFSFYLLLLGMGDIALDIGFGELLNLL